MHNLLIVIFTLWSVLIRPSLPSCVFHYNGTEVIPEQAEPEEPAGQLRYKYELGNLYAGQTEFPWIISITLEELSDLEAVGNLLTHMHVLTNCRVIVGFEKYSPPRNAPGNGRYYRGARSIKCAYASLILGEVDRTEMLTGMSDARLISGARRGTWVLKHPDCANGFNFAADFAIIGLSRPIFAIPPYVSYMPIFTTTGLHPTIPDSNDWVRLTTTTICYVAAWGRPYVGQDTETANHKVKIRAYAYADLSPCLNIWEYLCNKRTLEDHDLCDQEEPPVNAPGLICMNTRVAIGAVCDANRGAPVVCNGRVHGIVSRAYPMNLCYPEERQPFLVVNLHHLETGKPPFMPSYMAADNKQGAVDTGSDTVIMYVKSSHPQKDALAIFLIVFFWLA